MIEKLEGQSAPRSLEVIAEKVGFRIEALLSEEIERWSHLDPELVEPLTLLKEMVLAGGKRLRPAFCFWAYVGAGGDPESIDVLNAGCALELLHSFAIIHDDIMDASLTRRGLVALHKRFQDKHEGTLWAGESRRFGEGVAILLGDMAFVYADKMLLGAPVEAQEIFTELRLEVNIGQYLDLIGTANGTAQPRISRDQARRICLYKSGKYTVERPLHLGAALLGRLEKYQQSLSEFGVPLGEAFQLRDDLLGSFGDQTVTGKPVGEDLREGKPTVLAAIAIERVRGKDADFMRRRFGAENLSSDEVLRLQEILINTGARKEVEALADTLCGQAIAAIKKSELTQTAIEELESLANFVANRDL